MVMPGIGDDATLDEADADVTAADLSIETSRPSVLADGVADDDATGAAVADGDDVVAMDAVATGGVEEPPHDHASPTSKTSGTTTRRAGLTASRT